MEKNASLNQIAGAGEHRLSAVLSADFESSTVGVFCSCGKKANVDPHLTQEEIYDVMVELHRGDPNSNGAQVLASMQYAGWL